MEIIIPFIILMLYVFLILKYTIGWYKIKKLVDSDSTPSLSVVIALRNEENQIERLFQDLQSQIYPTDKIEFILVNDHSTDNTLELLQQNKIDNFIVVDLQDETGKKQAISKAVTIASSDIIVSTDADCSFSPNWAQTIVHYFADEKVKLVSGPVFLNKQKKIFQNLQALEFASLIGSGAGAIGSGSPIFCNAANMAYRKDVFLEVNEFEKDSAISGDDVFLLHSVKQKYPNAIVFAKKQDAIVITNGTESIKDFVNQRKRWAAKSANYKDAASIYASFLVFFFNLSLLYLFVMSFFDTSFLQLLVLFYTAKFVVDSLLLYPTLKFFNRTDLVKWILPFELFYSFYIVLIVILSFTQSFEWKGRVHKK